VLGARQRGRSDLRLRTWPRRGTLLAAQVVAAALVEVDGLAANQNRGRTSLFVDDDEADYLFKS